MLMFINPMLILTAENMIERSFEHRNPTLFAIGAGMLGVGTVGWAGLTDSGTGVRPALWVK